MQQHFNNDAERMHALKKSRQLVIILLVLVTLPLSYFLYQLFIR